MKFSKVKVGITFILVLLIVSILTFLYWDFVRNAVVVPIYYLLWLAGLILKSIPQAAFISLLVVIGLLVGVRTLNDIRGKPDAPAPARYPQQVESRYQYWNRLCESLNAGWFSRNLFMSESRKLLLSVLAQEYGVDIAEAEAMVRNKTFAIPAEVETLLLQRELQDEGPAPYVDQAVLARLKRRFSKAQAPRNPQIENLIVEINSFLEAHLEVIDDSNQLKF